MTDPMPPTPPRFWVVKDALGRYWDVDVWTDRANACLFVRRSTARKAARACGARVFRVTRRARGER